MATQHEIQKAVFLLLDGTTAVTDQLATHQYTVGKKAIYDGVPQPNDAGGLPAFPYVAIGEWTAVPWDTDSDDGRESTLTLHSFSRYHGNKELQNIMDAIKAVLHDADLAISAEWMVLCYLEFAESVPEADGVTRHGVQRFRIISQGA